MIQKSFIEIKVTLLAVILVLSCGTCLISSVVGEEVFITITREVDPSFYTLGVQENDESKYEVTLASRLFSDGSSTNTVWSGLIDGPITQGQRFLVQIDDISDDSFSYDLFLKTNTEFKKMQFLIRNENIVGKE